MSNNDEIAKYNIVCFSNQIWNYPLWTNKKHVMNRLAKQGHNIIFVDPPINFGRLFFKQLLAGAWDVIRLVTQTIMIKDLQNLTVYSPLRFSPIDAFEEKLSSEFYLSKINSLSEKVFDKNKKTIIWVYHVEFVGLPKIIEGLKHDILIYDCVDNYPAFPKYAANPNRKSWLIAQEVWLTKLADLVFTTAPGLFEKLKSLNSNVHFTPNVGDFEKFNSIVKRPDIIPEKMKDLKKPVIGFTGALDSYKFDLNLFKKLLERFPNYTFVLIGPFALSDREGSLKELGLEGYSNLQFFGTVDYSEIHRYFAGFDAFIIPYQLNEYTIGGCFPVKFHESLACGLPTIVTDLPTYKPFKDVCYISKSYDDFCDNLSRALEEDSYTLRSARIAVAKQNSWDGKVQTLLGLISDTLAKKI